MSETKDLDYTKVCINPMTKDVVKDQSETEITLQHLLYGCATSPLPGDETLAIGEKMRLHSMALKIANMKPLRPSDLLKLKARGAKMLSIIALGFMVEEIDAVVGEKTEPTD